MRQCSAIPLVLCILLLGAPRPAVALEVVVSPTAPGLCDPAIAAGCFHSLEEAVTAVNDQGDADNRIVIDTGTFDDADGGATATAPALLYDTTIEATAPTTDYSRAIGPLRANGASLTLRHLRVVSGVDPSTSTTVPAVSVIGGSLMAEDLFLGSGDPAPGPADLDAAIHVVGGHLDVTGLDAAGFQSGGVILDAGGAVNVTLRLVDVRIGGNDTAGGDLAAAVHAVGASSVTLEDAVFEENVGGPAVVWTDAATVVIRSVEVRDNASTSGGIVEVVPLEGTRTLVEDAVFLGNGSETQPCAALCVTPPPDLLQTTGPIDLDVRGSRFEGNVALGPAGDIAYHGPAGRLEVRDTRFRGSRSVEGAGAMAAAGGVTIRDVQFVDTGVESAVGEGAGGGVAARGAIECHRCTFEGTASGRGGAVFLDAPVEDGRTIARFEDSTFDGSAGGVAGGAFMVSVGVDLTIRRSTFTGGRALQGGVMDVRGAGDGHGAYVRIEASIFDGPTAGLNGGAFYVAGGAVLEVVGGRITGASALGEDADPADAAAAGHGGVAVVEPGARIHLRDTVISETHAAGFGGVLATAAVDFASALDGFPVGYPGWIVPEARACGQAAEGDRSDYGAEIALDGVRQTGGTAAHGSVAYFGDHDRVTITDSVFVGNAAEHAGTFQANGVAYFDLRRTELCSNVVGGRGAGVLLYEDAYPVHHTIENVVFQGGTASDMGSVVDLDLCTPDEGGRLLVRNNTFVGNQAPRGLVGGFARNAQVALVANIFGGGEVGIGLQESPFILAAYNLYYDLDEITNGSAEGLVPEITSVLAVPIYMDYRPGACDSVLVLDQASSPGNNAGDPDLVDWDGAPSSIGAYGGPNARIPDADGDGYNVIEDCDDHDPTVQEIRTWWLDCDGDRVFGPTAIQSCRAPSLETFDPDLNPGVAWPCEDGADPVAVTHEIDPATYDFDCDDTDPEVYPGAPSFCDGRDNNCDGVVDGDDSLDAPTWWPDADGDGFGDPDGTSVRACERPDGYADNDLDCDDTDPSIHPGAPEIPDDGIDQNCDGQDATSEPEEDPEEEEPEEEEPEDPGEEEAEDPADDDGGGCGCSAGTSASGAWLGGLFVLTALGIVRRRACSRSPGGAPRGSSSPTALPSTRRCRNGPSRRCGRATRRPKGSAAPAPTGWYASISRGPEPRMP